MDAVGRARQMCWDYDWVCDLDIKGFFDNLDHDLMMRAVKKHAKDKWMQLYIERWLKAPAQDETGQLLKRERGSPQGGVVSPLLANLFLHYAFDLWMIIRDRVTAMIKEGMTLEQVKAAKPTMDYDPLYGRQAGVTAKFVEAVYKSLKEKS